MRQSKACLQLRSERGFFVLRTCDRASQRPAVKISTDTNATGLAGLRVGGKGIQCQRAEGL